MAAHLTGVYLHVVADVISNVRADFLSEGIDEAVLQELQSLWELNMMQAGTIQASVADLSYARAGGGGHSAITPVHDLNMPYEGETPTAELLFPPTPVHTPLPTQTPVHTPLPTQTPVHTPLPNFNASGASDHSETGIIGDIAIGRPVPFMSPPWMNPSSMGMSLGMNPKLDINVAYNGDEEEDTPSGQYPVTKEFLPPTSGKRKRDDMAPSHVAGTYFPQHDGPTDTLTTPFVLPLTSDGVDAKNSLHTKDSRALPARTILSKGLHQCEQSEEMIVTTTLLPVVVDSHSSAASSSIPQLDGIGDNTSDDGAANDQHIQVLHVQSQWSGLLTTDKPPGLATSLPGVVPPLENGEFEL